MNKDNITTENTSTEILASSSFGERRIAVLEDNKLVELVWERNSARNIVGNIYKARVENVLPGISSAFVDIGCEKNAYLYISDVISKEKQSIDKTLKKGDYIMVQVVKDVIGTKGMKVTMDITLPGRYLVLAPYQTFVGVSKNIEDDDIRKNLNSRVENIAKQYLSGMGCIVRTEAEDALEDDLRKEIKYLYRQWKSVNKNFEQAKTPTLIHEDMDAVLAMARDGLSDNVKTYLLDDQKDYTKVSDFVSRVSPEHSHKIKFYKGKTHIFEAFDIEKEIESLRKIKIPLQSGGSIIIQEAESLCAIDVNTGKFTGKKHQEDTVTETNIEAAREIAKQLRLRNIGGIIVIDFIDMRRAYNRHKIFKALNDFVSGDNAKISILPITRLGLIEMTRERRRESTISLITDECPQCGGGGRVLSVESMRIKIQREIYDLTQGRGNGKLKLSVTPALAEGLKRHINSMEKNINRKIKMVSDPNVKWEDYKIVIE